MTILTPEKEAAISTEREGREQAEGEVERLQKLVYVPGVTKCAKCGLRLISSTLNASDGSMRANNEPQACLNGCGPMWKVTERDAGNDVCDRLDAAAAQISALQALIAEKDKALKVIAAASERFERLFGGRMSEVTRVFENITRVARTALNSTEAKIGKPG